ncbi:hypothetical protein QUB41_07675 [Microcoleus sp. AT8-B2]|uniref:hypothetical protein n=1 Tax=unclassified Microcoleus TaxID=2642155 RepID=UPI002FD20AF8
MPTKGHPKPHGFPHYRRAIALRSRFLPPEQMFPKNLVLLGSNARSLAVSDTDEQVRVLVALRL